MLRKSHVHLICGIYLTCQPHTTQPWNLHIVSGVHMLRENYAYAE